MYSCYPACWMPMSAAAKDLSVSTVNVFPLKYSYSWAMISENNRLTIGEQYKGSEYLESVWGWGLPCTLPGEIWASEFTRVMLFVFFRNSVERTLYACCLILVKTWLLMIANESATIQKSWWWPAWWWRGRTAPPPTTAIPSTHPHPAGVYRNWANLR